MGISAKVIADSIYENGPRLTTFVLRYPRFVHAEFMTHRVFSRNAASSRAIPVQKMIDAVLKDPAMPVHWGKNQSGMQAREELDAADQESAQKAWLVARDSAVEHVNKLLDLGLHKQISNRILEPWMHIEVVCTATDWANFYALRDHPDAQPEMQALARAMIQAHSSSIPKELKSEQWHLPFVDEPGDPALLTKISAARCARVSYLKHDGTKSSVEEDLGLYDRLMGGTPKHASPTEHQAKVPGPQHVEWGYGQLLPSLLSNLTGWIQFRKLHENENTTEYKGFKSGW